MFIPAKELMGFVPMDSAESKSFYEAPWMVQRKREQFLGMGQRNEKFAESIATSGVKQPVILTKDWTKRGHTGIEDGHHRTIAAYDANPDMEVPVIYAR